MLKGFTPPAGVVNDGTAYSSRGTWHECDKVRFKGSFPEKIGGWVKESPNQFKGICRSLFQWRDLLFNKQLFVGTHLKCYVDTNTSLTDITPIRLTVTLANPMGSTSGLPFVNVTHASHGATIGDYVTVSGATSFGGFLAADLNGDHVITGVSSAGVYYFTMPTNATSTVAAGGGAAVTFTYQINTGLPDHVQGAGWGAGGFGVVGWGLASSTTTAGQQMRLWSADNWGENLVFCQRQGGIYYWPANSSSRATLLSSQVGASDVPVVANCLVVGPDDRRLIAFGCSDYASSVQDPLLIRWADRGSVMNFTPSTTSTAGFIRIASGSEIITALKSRSEIVFWTDVSMHSLTFVGGTQAYAPNILSPHCNIAGPNAAAAVDDTVYWMGKENFYTYKGQVMPLPCTVKRKIFDDINRDQMFKVYCATNSKFKEIMWFYPSAGSTECDRYVTLNYEDQVWYFGTMARTAWIDFGAEDQPRATSPDGYIYFQETGCDDGSTSPPTPLNAYIKSAPFELAGYLSGPDGGNEMVGDGGKFMFLRRIVPDVSFEGSTSPTPQVTMELTPQDYPGAAPGAAVSGQAIKTASVDQWTTVINLRLRSRQFCLKVSSADLGNAWRLGVQRFDVQSDGLR